VSIHAFDKSFFACPGYLQFHTGWARPSLEIDGEGCSKPVPIAEILLRTVQPRTVWVVCRAHRTGWRGCVDAISPETVCSICAALTQQHCGAARRFRAQPIVMKLEAAAIIKCL